MGKQIVAVHVEPTSLPVNWTHIASLKWRDEKGRPGEETREAIFHAIKAGESYYSVGTDTRRAEVEAYSVNGHPFIRTKGDISKPDNLLSLPRY